MDKTTLVETDLQFGREVIKELERQGTAIDVAAWLQDDDSGVWRLLVSSPTLGETGFRPVYEAILNILRDRRIADFDLDNFLVASPHEHLVKDLKRWVGTDNGLHDIRLDSLSIGNQRYRSARIYRVLGNAIGNDARVRVRATGQMGTVRGVIDTPSGPRYLVLFDRSREDAIRPLDGQPRPPIGQDFGADDLDFLYVVRTGGWPEQNPDWLLTATGVSTFTGTAVTAPPDQN